MNAFHGMRVIESVYLVEPGEPRTERRTWRERLFSRPWRPWVATKVVVPQVPHRGAVQLNATTLVMHPETLRQLRKLLPADAAVDRGVDVSTDGPRA